MYYLLNGEKMHQKIVKEINVGYAYILQSSANFVVIVAVSATVPKIETWWRAVT